MRYTVKDAEKSVERLANKLGRKSGTCWIRTKSGKNKAIIGCLRADYNSVYGGAILTEIINEGGAVDHPLGEGRLKPYEFTKMINGVERGLENWCKSIKKNKKR